MYPKLESASVFISGDEWAIHDEDKALKADAADHPVQGRFWLTETNLSIEGTRFANPLWSERRTVVLKGAAGESSGDPDGPCAPNPSRYGRHLGAE
jgi:hypothetical protein